MRRAAALCLLLVLLAPAWAEDAPRPLTLVQALEEVRNALATQDDASLADLAGRQDPDPWRIADALCTQSRFEAALAFAGHAPGLHAPRMIAYVTARRERPTPPELIALLAKVEATFRAAGPQAAWEAAAPAPEAADTLTGVTLLARRGHYAHLLRKRAEAEEQLLLAAEAALAIGWTRMASATLNDAGLARFGAGTGRGATDIWERRLGLLREAGDVAGQVDVLTWLAVARRREGAYARGIEELEAAERLAQGAGLTLPDRTLQTLGSMHHDLGNHAQALIYQRLLLARAERSGDPLAMAMSLSGIGVSLASTGAGEEALALHRRALALAETAGKPGYIGTALGNMGVALGHLRRFDEALDCHMRAREIMTEIGDKLGLMRTLANIALCHRERKEHELAIRFQREAVAASFQSGVMPMVVYNLWGLMGVLARAGQHAEAVAVSRRLIKLGTGLIRGLSFEQTVQAREQLAALFGTAFFSALETGKAEDVAYFLESGRAYELFSMMGDRRAFDAAAVPQALRVEAEAAASDEERLASALRRARARGELAEARALVAQLDVVRAGREQVASRIQRLTRQAAASLYRDPDTLETIQGRVGVGQALVFYGLAKEGALAMVVTMDGVRCVRLGEAKPIEDLCETVAPLLSDESSSRAEDAPLERCLKQLRALLVTPLGLGEDVHTILVSPHGPLSFLPFSVLDAGRRVAYMPSGTVHGLLRAMPASGGRAVLAFGDPLYQGGKGVAVQTTERWGRELTPLPASGDEVRAIGSSVFLQGQASEGMLRAKLGESQAWRAVHLACHGRVNADKPGRSMLALAPDGEHDGFLTVLDILGLRVTADLVVLSACETARGKLYWTEGIEGFSRAFMFAGAPRVICSLWKVDDDATQALMVKFYELWNPKEGTGLGAAEALKQAQAFVRSQAQWEHPYYWAAWVLWGLPE